MYQTVCDVCNKVFRKSDNRDNEDTKGAVVELYDYTKKKKKCHYVEPVVLHLCEACAKSLKLTRKKLVKLLKEAL